VLRDFKLQDLNIRKSLWKIIETAGLPRRLKINSQQGTAETTGSRWGVIISVKGVCALGRTVWYTIQDE